MLISEEKRAEALKILSELYPNPKPELHFSSPYELLVAVMLSAQCTDKQVNKVTAELFQVANTPEQMIALPEDKLSSALRVWLPTSSKPYTVSTTSPPGRLKVAATPMSRSPSSVRICRSVLVASSEDGPSGSHTSPLYSRV